MFKILSLLNCPGVGNGSKLSTSYLQAHSVQTELRMLFEQKTE